MIFGRKPIKRQATLQDVTIRDFSGGLNEVDSDLNLSIKFAKRLRNLHQGLDGSNAIRPGTILFSDVQSHVEEIVNSFYFSGAIWCVGTNGKVARVSATGVVLLAFDDSFAASLPGSPTAWGQTDFCSFCISRGNLTIHNGVNKPLVVTPDSNVSYLRDLATGSNANTPIGRYAVQHARYLIIGGRPDAPSTLSIGASDTTGTFLGDPGPNDAIEFDLSSRVPSGEPDIRGLSKFRDRLIVMFDDAILPGVLGIYDSADHTPQFDDAVQQHGAVSHLSAQTLNEDMLFCGIDAVNTVTRALFTGVVKAETTSHLISPSLRNQIGALKQTATLQDRIHSVYNSLEDEYMLFIPNADDPRQITETTCFTFKDNTELRVHAWSVYHNWRFRSSCVSSLKRVFFTQGSQVYLLENEQDKKTYGRDYVGDQEMFDDDTTFTDQTGWTPVADFDQSGIPIPFDWILPWSDNGKRMNTKESRYVGLDTLGTGQFTLQMFIDNAFYDREHVGEEFLDDTLFDDGLGWDVEALTPALSMDFMGGDALGYGLSPFGHLYGDGRPTSIEKLYAWRAKYKLFKMRLTGEADGPLKFVSLFLAYAAGSIRRS
jgi:hypothetical protein